MPKHIKKTINYINQLEGMSDGALFAEHNALESHIKYLSKELTVAHRKLRSAHGELKDRKQVCEECRTEWYEKPSKKFSQAVKSISCPNCYRDTYL